MVYYRHKEVRANGKIRERSNPLIAVGDREEPMDSIELLCVKKEIRTKTNRRSEEHLKCGKKP